MNTIRMSALISITLCWTSANAATIDWEGWRFDYTTSDNSSGLVLNNVYFNDKQILAKASMPVMRVKYDNDVCGPYADILHTSAQSVARQGAPNSACDNTSLCERTFTLDGEKILEVGSNWQIGEYQIYQTYYFSEEGYFDARVYSRGLQCHTNHSHHAHWMLDFDIDGRENDKVVLPDGSVPAVEFNDLKSNSEFWSIEDSVTGSAVSLLPADDDGVAGDFARWDFAARAYRSTEVGRWTLGSRGEIGENFLNGENINSNDNVIWYVSHLPHSASEGASIWHASGPRIDTNHLGEPPTPPNPVPSPTPVEGNLLANGDFAEGKAGWFDCGPSNNTSASAGQMRINNGGCLYQEVSATVGEHYELTCDASREGNGWTVMELGFLDENYTGLSSAVSQIRTGSAVTLYDESGVAPENTIYALAVLYSEDDTLYDNCNLSIQDDPNPPTTTGPEDPTNLLRNGDFENSLTDWNSCAATSLVEVSNDAFDGEKSIVINNGGCLYQEFDVETGTTYRLDCEAKRNGELYSSMTLAMLDSQYASLSTQEIPIESAAYSNYSATISAPADTQFGTVVVYSEDPTHFDGCQVVVN